MSSTTLKLMSAGAVEGPVRALAPAFTEAGGPPVDLTFNTVGALRERFLGGETADVIILSTPAVDALRQQDRFVADGWREVGKVATGVAVRDGALMPDIGSVENFTRMLGHAQSIAANDPAHGGSSGIYFIDLLKRMGLYEAIKPKLILGKTGRDCALTVARGDAEIGITFVSEFLPVPGTRVVGPFPAEIAFVNGYAAAIPLGAQSEPARAFLNFLASGPARARFKEFGFE